MRKGKIVPLVLMIILFSAFIAAQTLDEVLHPLLKKGQWDLSLDYKNFGYKHISIDLFQGEITCYDSQVILFPRLSFGLAKNIQLTIDGAYQFPITFSMPGFDEWDYWRETNTIRTLSAQLLLRPARNMELSLFLLHGQSETDVHYPRTLGIDAHYTKNFAGNILILRGTWLSTIDGESRPLRADLDGRYGPLLKKGRWQIEPEILVRSHEYEYRLSLDVLPDYLDKNIDSTDTRLRLNASFGFTDHLQAEADVYWQPSFQIRESSRSLITWWDKSEHYNESETSRLYSDYWGGRGSFVWRPVSQWELNLACSRSQLEEKVTPFKYTHIISQVDLGTTWISKAKRPGITLAADLPGLHHPLLEKKQFELDGRICYRAYREIDDSNDGFWNTNSWLVRIRTAYGLGNSLQASAYYGIYFFHYWLSNVDYEIHHTLGMELKWRLKKRAEVYAALNYKPMNFLDVYPPFMLGIHERLEDSGYHDFLSTAFGETINIELGCKLML